MKALEKVTELPCWAVARIILLLAGNKIKSPYYKRITQREELHSLSCCLIRLFVYWETMHDMHW